jgi:predicted AlkP superfamily pyrophosphatase or phosphodiesterase
MIKFLLMFNLLGLGLHCQPLVADTPKLIVAIAVDQLRYDYLERFEDQFTTNGFRLLMDHGAFMTSARYDYVPTVTAPGHATYLSGTPPSVHGIIGNEWFDRQKRTKVVAVDDADYEGVGTVSTNVHISPRNFIGGNFADEMRLRYGSKVVGISMKARAAVLPAGKQPTGAYWFEEKSGRFVTSTYYMSELPKWLTEFNDQKRVEDYRGTNWTRLLPADAYHHPDERVGEGHLLGETNCVFPHVIHYTEDKGYEAILDSPFSNELLAGLARAAIEGERLGEGGKPDLLCVSFSSLDACGHEFGPYSQETQDVALRLDRTLSEFFNYLNDRIGLHQIQIVLTSDHGVAPLPEYARELGLDAKRVDEAKLMTELTNRLSARYGSGDLLLSPNFHYGNLYFDPAALERLRLTADEVAEFIRDWAYSTGDFEAVFTRRQLLDGLAPGLIGSMVANGYNAERSGDIVLVMKPYMISSTGTTGTTHGSPYSYDAHVPVIFFGSAFKPGRYANEFHITDIVSMLCASLKLEVPPGNIGKPVLEALKLD